MKVIIFGATGMVGQGALRESLLAADVEEVLAVAAAHKLAELNPAMTFIYVSGAGTNPDGRARWARVKGRAEVEVIKTFPNGYGFRPGIIQPTHGATSKARVYRVGYSLAAPLISLLDRFAPKLVTSTDRLGQAMLRAARTGFASHLVENADLR